MTSNSNNHNPLANIEIVGEGFDDPGRRFIKLKVKGSDRDLPLYSMEDILKPERLYSDLADAGCKLFASNVKNGLQNKLQNYQQVGAPSFSVVTRLGCFQNFYVRPDEIIGTPPAPVELALGSLNSDMLNKYRRRGSLQSWQEKIGKLCTGNSRLMFATSLACTGPILSLVAGPRTGGFQICGKAETGKTAMAMVAGSIWGCHRDLRKEKGFAESWNTTSNALEETAQAHSDALLILDETNLAGKDEKERATTVLSGAFRLSEFTKKKRYNEAEAPAWRLYFLSTSNFTLDELADCGEVAVDDQHRGRLVDIVLPPAPGTFGIYEDLHGFSDGAALTDTLKTRCRSVFGTPGYELVRKLYRDESSRAAAKKFVAARRNGYINRLRERAGSLGLNPLERATARFATVYAAGCLAIKYGIFTWSRKDLLRAVLSCQLDSLVKPKGKSDPADKLRQKLVVYLAQNRRHFVSLDRKKLKSSHRFGSVPGYSQTYKQVDWFYLKSDQLKGIIGTDRVARRLKRHLVEQGVMATTGKRDLVQRPIFKRKGNRGYRWVHAIRASVLDG
jgi:putative DNA primase/helicase